MTFQNIALIGASGNLGSAILFALKQAPFNLTVLTRRGSTTFKEPNDSCLKVIPTDYESITSISKGLEGIDAVVCAIGSAAIPLQIKIIDAAIAVGVKRFIPSEFGADTFNKYSRKLPVYLAKVGVQNHLQAAANDGKIEWTAILGGPFLDYGLARGLLGFNPEEKKAILYDGGVRPISTTLLADLGTAVVGVLKNPSATCNRPVYVQSVRISQLQVLNIFQDLTGIEWQRVHVNTADLEWQGREKLGKQDFSGNLDCLLRAIYGENFGCDFAGREENALVEVKGLNRGDFTQLVEKHI